MSADNLYLGAMDYEGDLTAEMRKAADLKKNAENGVTHLARLDLKDGDLKLAASVDVPGQVLNQFAFDEYDGNFRIVTTLMSNETTDHVYNDRAALFILNQDLEVVGALPSIVKNESVKSVRFDGKVGYVVTFERVDPLFAIDLSTPKKPKVMSALKIPGFSTYMQPWSQGRLLGLGRDGDEDGESEWLKLSMFDTSDPFDVTEEDTLVIESNEAAALYEHKALLISSELNLIGFSASNWYYSGDSAKYFIYFYDEKDGFVAWQELPIKGVAAWEYNNLDIYSVRGLTIGSDFYLCGPAGVAVYDLNSFDDLAYVRL
jgi:uncharacterized secreted protein with C-terminal beta-propeller domain